MVLIPCTTSRNLVIIPLFNEERTVVSVLTEVRRHYPCDILIVDDGSTDHSVAKVLENFKTRVSIIHHTANQGYGQSLRDGFAYAVSHDYDIAVTMDCDAQHEPSHLHQFFDAIRSVDIVSGSRYLPDSRIVGSAPRQRSEINRLIAEEINQLTGYGITDAFCGFKAYRVAALRRFKLDETGYALPLQIWIQAHFLKLKVQEIPVDRIYFHIRRSFGAMLDDPAQRLTYYRESIKKEIKKWQ